jgi:hypothetical protein
MEQLMTMMVQQLALSQQQINALSSKDKEESTTIQITQFPANQKLKGPENYRS